MTKPKPKKRDPLAGLRKKFRPPWLIDKSKGTCPITGYLVDEYHVHSRDGWMLTTQSRTLARAIAKLGDK